MTISTDLLSLSLKYLRIAGRHRPPQGVQFIPPLLSRQVLPVILCRSIKTKQIHERSPNKQNSVVIKTFWYTGNIFLVLIVWSESLLGGEGNFIPLGVSCDSCVWNALLANTLKNTNGNKKTSVPSSNFHGWKYQPSKIERLMVIKRSDGLMEVWLSTNSALSGIWLQPMLFRGTIKIHFPTASVENKPRDVSVCLPVVVPQLDVCRSPQCSATFSFSTVKNPYIYLHS